MTEVPISNLPVGSVCRSEFIDTDFRLVFVNQCRALVEPVRRQRREIKDHEGAVIAEFDSPGGRYNISPGTLVVPVADNEHRSVSTAPGSPSMPPRRGSGKPAQVPLRQANPATKRGRLFALLLESPTGDSNIKTLMSAMAMERSAVMTYLFETWRDHGMGYQMLNDDVVRVSMLPGVEPFKEVPSKPAASAAKNSTTRTLQDSSAKTVSTSAPKRAISSPGPSRSSSRSTEKKGKR